MKRVALLALLGLVALGTPACSGPEDSGPASEVDNSVGAGEAESGASPGAAEKEEQTAESPVGAKGEAEPPGRPALVGRVIDGDTIEVELARRMADVRLIGVDTPETVHPTQPVGCYGREASRFTTNMLEGKEVRLEFDIERQDRYGRTLAYVWLDGKLFNEVLVSRGFAQVSTYPPNVKYVDVFVKAQREARSHERGLWGPACSELEPVETGGGGKDCDPSYPDVCIPPPPPDLDCGEIEYRNFRVTGNDPHGFDGNNDGVGCET